jgi:glycosyltransferase involved in cell wall biosynthesis
MRILIMADTPENPDSGAAGTEYQTVQALRRLGHAVDTVWADQLPRRVRHGNLHYLLELPFTYQARMTERLRSAQYDVVHASQPHGYLAARAAGRRAPPRPVFVHRSHGFEPRVLHALAPWRSLEPARPIARRTATAVMTTLLEFNNRAIARYADGHLVSAALCGDYLHERYGVPHSRIAVVPQAPPPLYQERTPGAMTAARLDRILYVGQFAFIKAPQILAQAFEQVLAQRPQASATWVCAASHHREAAALLGPLGRARVKFLDWVPQRELMDIYDDHGVFLFPSLFEGFGKAFLEAMARGLVVVASAEGGARDLIVDGRNGMLVPVGDAQALARACIAIQAGAVDAATLSAEARRTAALHTWDRVARETVDFYRRLIALR